MIVSRLFKKKLELYFENSSNMLYKWKLCNDLYTDAQREVFNCPLNPSKFISHRGELKSFHINDNWWDLNEYVMQHRNNKMQWKEIYWIMWARTKIFSWKEWGKYFRPLEMKNSWRFHLQSIKWMHGENVGRYPCWNFKINKFEIGITIEDVSRPTTPTWTSRHSASDTPVESNKEGCQLRDHVIDYDTTNYLSPSTNPQKEDCKNWPRISFQEDMKHFERNKHIILK